MEPFAVHDPDMIQRVRSWTRLPPLRIDLRIVRAADNKFRLCDPHTLKYLELYELECLVVQIIDGERTLTDLHDFARTYNPSITRHQVESLVVELATAGLLEEVTVAKEGMGKVIPLPVTNNDVDEFASFRNEVMLDLQREQALVAARPTLVGERAPFFEARSTPTPMSHDDDDDDDLGGGTNIAVGADPFRVLESRSEQMIAAGETDDDTALSASGQKLDFSVSSVLVENPPPPAPAETPATRAPTTSTPAAVAAEQEHVWQQAKKKKKRFWQWTWLRVLVLLGILITVSAIVEYPLHVTSECTIVPNERAYVRSLVPGVLAEILVDEGSVVKKGDVIAKLDDRDLVADRLKATAEVERIEAELQRLRHGARREEIAEQRAIVQARLTAASFAQKEADRRSQMANEGVGSKQAQEQGELDMRVKQHAAAEAVAALRLLEAGSRPEEIAAKEASLKRAKAELEFVQQKLDTVVVIRAPIAGIVLTPKFRERLRERVEAGGLVCEIADTTIVQAEIFVPEREADTVAIGMPVTVKVESFPLNPFEGKVGFIAPAVEQRDKSNVVRVVVKLENKDRLLRQDMTGYGEVDCGKRSLLGLATRRLLRWIRVRFLI